MLAVGTTHELYIASTVADRFATTSSGRTPSTIAIEANVSGGFLRSSDYATCKSNSPTIVADSLSSFEPSLTWLSSADRWVFCVTCSV